MAVTRCFQHPGRLLEFHGVAADGIIEGGRERKELAKLNILARGVLPLYTTYRGIGSD